MGRFEDQVVWITGGGSGIGRELALAFAREGAHVAISGRRADRLQEVVDAVTALNRQAVAVPCDVTDEAAVAGAVEAVVARLGQLDVAVANAGFGVIGGVADLPDEAWRRQFDVNVFGLLHVVRHALPRLRETKGRVVLVSSVSAFVYAPRNGAYNASKAAVRAIGETLSAELAGTGVTCTTVYPGFVASEIGRVDNEGVFQPDKRDKRPARLMWPADRAARVIVDAVAARRRAFVFTGHGRAFVALSRWMPGLTAALVARAGGKPAKA